jgi:hypothetical protein
MVLNVAILFWNLNTSDSLQQWRTEDDPDAPPPKWMAMVDSLTPLKALGFGFGLLLICGKCWVFMLGSYRRDCRSGIRPASQHHRLHGLCAAGRNSVAAADLDQACIATTIQEPACFNLLLADPIQPHNRDRSLAGVRPDLPV